MKHVLKWQAGHAVSRERWPLSILSAKVENFKIDIDGAHRK
jgi:hypothetical protein